MFARLVRKVNFNRLSRLAHTECTQVQQKMFSGAKESTGRFDPWELPTYIFVYGGVILTGIALKCAPETSTKNWAFKTAQERINKEHKY